MMMMMADYEDVSMNNIDNVHIHPMIPRDDDEYDLLGRNYSAAMRMQELQLWTLVVYRKSKRK